MFTDIIDKVQNFIQKNFQWLANIYSQHTNCCFFQTENELLHLLDIRFFLDNLVPYVNQPEVEDRNIKYLHNMIYVKRSKILHIICHSLNFLTGKFQGNLIAGDRPTIVTRLAKITRLRLRHFSGDDRLYRLLVNNDVCSIQGSDASQCYVYIATT